VGHNIACLGLKTELVQSYVEPTHNEPKPISREELLDGFSGMRRVRDNLARGRDAPARGALLGEARVGDQGAGWGLRGRLEQSGKHGVATKVEGGGGWEAAASGGDQNVGGTESGGRRCGGDESTSLPEGEDMAGYRNCGKPGHFVCHMLAHRLVWLTSVGSQ
jgi:hypothetical protein